ncbi:uncharacterized protein LOC109998776 [Xyrichtys novacula]|uniref:Uncharacterized protein LOC109998776 n=1 Tax=Xyrichtys novacula TaxID=13765 RepID=A0AAV1F0M4_XYRNO|nr:uncharacterized protein LOC109998776 [Xyrichtys novacula]
MDPEEFAFLARGIQANNKYYEWQLLVGHQWQRVDNDHIIETHYCHPGAKGIHINTRNGKVFIDFDEFQTLNAALKVQRLTFLSQGQTEEVGWYFRDDQLWREYGSQSSGMVVSSISSSDVERQFTLNRRGTFSFTVGSTSYTLDFSSMTQTNGTTGMCRNIRRRPKFNTKSLSSTSAASSNITPPNRGYKWEVMIKEGVWSEYEAHICAFDSADIEAHYTMNPQAPLQFRINGYSYTLDFQSMCQVNEETGTRRAVRRVICDGSQPNNSSSSSPQWQFLDGTWQNYKKGRRQSSVSSQDIELQFQQNPTGIMLFNTKRFNYELDFSAMTQRNLSTNTTRQVRRLNP